jgi:predicted DCC family thiol-disulfide oxidoreductase YuxK
LYEIDANKCDSVIYIYKDKAFIKSTAALQIAKKLGGGWPLLYGLIIIPRFIRDWVYGFIAKNRYRWFGKKDSCMIPSPELKSRFLG